MNSHENHDSRITVRELGPEDYEQVKRLQIKCFPDIEPWTQREFALQLKRFPEGQIGVTLDGELVASSSSMIVVGEEWVEEHTFDEVSSNGTIRNHEEEGDTLYGLDIVVDPEHRGQRLARRIYEKRKALILKRNLRGFFIAGRIPGYMDHQDQSTPEEYVEMVVKKELIDSTLTSQLANGFVIRKILKDYLPEDVESSGHAVLMEWRNPEWVPLDARVKRIVRTGAVQYQMRPLANFEEFAMHCEFFAQSSADYRCDFLLYPELLTNQLLALVPAERPALAARRLDEFTDRYVDLFSRLAIKYNTNIIAGSHLTVEDGVLYNIAYLFHRDGRIDKQYKLHITPSEAHWWGVSSGSEMKVFDTDCGKVAILICYDVEFPELARIARARGANLFFVPYNTDLRSAYTRVRTCAHARCIENNVYVAMSGACGNLPNVEGADIHYSRSAILTPSDVPFARDGVGSEANDNVETLVIYDLDFALLRKTNRQGAVRTWTDRRTDYYEVRWKDPESEPEGV